MNERFSIVEQRDGAARKLVEVTGMREAEAVVAALRNLDHRVELVRLDPPLPLVGSGTQHSTEVASQAG
jgi:hypothetical protein